MNSVADGRLSEHKIVMLELLDRFDAICRKHDIPYQLFAGSALGAVRHQGFIPWDDDLDVVMLRQDYERFLRVAPGELDPEAYFLQEEFSTHWPMYFSKLRKNNTAAIERYIPRDRETHQGIYMDIFPCDNLADNPLVRKVQFAASKVVIAKSLYRRGYLTDSRVKTLIMQVCRVIPGSWMRSIVHRKRDRRSASVHTFLGGGVRYDKNIFPRTWFEESVLLTFEGRTVPVSAFYHEMLTRLYGDYMVPTPEDQRGCKVHAEIVDTKRSYSDYLEIQKEMKFEEYSRSIR